MGKSDSTMQPRYDSYGKPFKYPRAENVTPQEHAKICHEINRLYHVRSRGKKRGYIVSYAGDVDSPAYTYWFEIHEFDEYNIFSKTLHTH